MKVFGDYARYYNLLYKNKDYASESRFVLDRLQDNGCTPRTLLDLGCGTGKHALEMAWHGMTVKGVDMSDTMLSMGKNEIQRITQNTQTAIILPELHQGDVRSIRLNQTFDAATSLFHVMSYQNTEEDALAELETAKQHLKRGGIFLFDFWYGPGVLTDPPVECDKIMEDDDTLVHRHASPRHRANDNIVEVHYTIKLTDKNTGAENELCESHSMRYWFMPELRYLARQCGFSVVGEGAWMQTGGASTHTWNAWMTVKK